MGISNKKALLFIDLDEVLFTRVATGIEWETVMALHPSMVEDLRPLSDQLVVLTHRFKSEALQMIAIIPGLGELFVGIVAAEELIRIALASGRIFPLLNKGIRKSFIIRWIERKYGVRPGNMAILDDDPANVAAVLDSGGGIGMLAPKPVHEESEVNTFDLSAALAVYRDTRGDGVDVQTRVSLPADRIYRLCELPRGEVKRSIRMGQLRRMAKTVRSALF